MFFNFSFDCDDEEVQSDGDDDDEVNGNDSDEEGGMYFKDIQITHSKSQNSGGKITLSYTIIRSSLSVCFIEISLCDSRLLITKNRTFSTLASVAFQISALRSV